MKNKFAKINFIKSSNSSIRREVFGCPIAFAEVGVKGRVKSVLNYKKPAFWAIIVALSACIAVAVGFLTDPKGNIKPEDIYAIGKDGIVTIEEYEKKYQSLLDDAYTESEAKKLAHRQCLEHEATYQEAIRQGFTVTKKEIRQYIADLKEGLNIASNGPDKLKEIISEYGSEEAYFEYLEVACEKSLPVNKYLTDLLEQWSSDFNNDFDSFDEYKNVVVGKLVINEDFKLSNGESVNYLIEELATEEPFVTEKNDADKYAATYKDKMSINSINDYDHAIALCEDAVKEFIDAVKYEKFYDFTPYIENDMLIAWIEYRALNHMYEYDTYTEYEVEAENLKWHENYALFRVGVSNENQNEVYSYLVVQNIDGKLRITDWYWDVKDSKDTIFRGEFNYSFNPTFWEKVESTKSEISTGVRFKITNKIYDFSETLHLTDEFLIFIMFQNGWSEGQALSEVDCDFELEVYGNKILYNASEGIFVDVKNNRSLSLNETQREGFYNLLNEYYLVVMDEYDPNYGVELNIYNVTPTSTDIVISRNDKYPDLKVHTGSYYWIEQYGTNQWEQLDYIETEQNIGWTMSAILILNNNTRDFSNNWEHLYGTLPPGHYRIGKEITISSDKTSRDIVLYAGFEILDER